jgi:hypothetical protein
MRRLDGWASPNLTDSAVTFEVGGERERREHERKGTRRGRKETEKDDGG